MELVKVISVPFVIMPLPGVIWGAGTLAQLYKTVVIELSL
jgi:hypothetical protein